jgi:hypothetical protein
MAIALTDVQLQRYSPPIDDSKTKTISVLVAYQCRLFRVGLRAFLVQQSNCSLIGEATHLEECWRLPENSAQISCYWTVASPRLIRWILCSSSARWECEESSSLPHQQETRKRSFAI